MRRPIFGASSAATPISEIEQQLYGPQAAMLAAVPQSAPQRTRTPQLAALELRLPAEASTLGAVRQTLGGLCALLRFDEQVIHDVGLAITEACTNVVLHAYPEQTRGMLFIDATAERNEGGAIELTITIRDDGGGIGAELRNRQAKQGAERAERARPAGEPQREGLGLGLRLIGTLADSMQLRSGLQGSTELTMTFVNDEKRSR